MKLLLPSLVLVSLLALGTMDVKSAEAKTLELDGFSFEIPKGCESEQEENRFATDTANLDCGDNREMVFEVGTFEELVDMNQAPEDIVSELESNLELLYSENSPEIFESGADKYTINNFRAPYALATWTHTGHNLFGAELEKDIAGMMIAIKIDENRMVLGQYLAPQEEFDKFLSKAEGTFESVKSTSSIETETLENTGTNSSKGTSNSNQFPETSKYCSTAKTQLAKDLCDNLLS